MEIDTRDMTRFVRPASVNQAVVDVFRVNGEQLVPEKRSLTRRVVQRADAIGRVLGINEHQRTRLALASCAHRLGELCLPAELTAKCFLDMTRAELDTYGLYPAYSTLFVTQGHVDNPFFDILSMHREYVGGAGFPSGRPAAVAPIEARILCVATEYEELMMKRASDAAEEHDILKFFIRNLTDRYDSAAVEALLLTLADQAGRH